VQTVTHIYARKLLCSESKTFSSKRNSSGGAGEPAELTGFQF
jgi:hypothetical protein